MGDWIEGERDENGYWIKPPPEDETYKILFFMAMVIIVGIILVRIVNNL